MDDLKRRTAVMLTDDELHRVHMLAVQNRIKVHEMVRRIFRAGLDAAENNIETVK